MTYDLVYSERAKRDLINATEAMARHAPLTAERWFNNFVFALSKLSRDAAAYGFAPESEHCSVEVRQFIYRTKSRRANRALYTIQGSTVVILAIRRPGQDLLTDDELARAMNELD